MENSSLIELTNILLDSTSSLAILILLIGFMASFAVRDGILRFFRLFLYRDSSTPELAPSERKVIQIEKRIKGLERELTDKVLSEKSELISLEIDKYLDNNLKSVIDEKLSNTEVIHSALLDNLKNVVRDETKTYISSTSLEELQEAIEIDLRSQRKEADHSSLLITLEKEERSASMLKMVMINLFVIATFAFIMLNVGKFIEFDKNTTIAIVALYVSLGAFMLYIIRTSHYRSSVLLAIKEDERNYHNFEEYLSSYKSGGDLSEHDVDVVRMIMTNRSEREHKANHPYEVILKGITGSNIQFKGGKMSMGGAGKSSDS